MVLPILYLHLRRLVHRLARRRFILLAVAFTILWITSALLFYKAEEGYGLTLSSSLYWALITMATVGYGDIVPHTGAGRVVASLAAVFGIAVYTLFISTLADYFMEATVKAAMGLGTLHRKRIIVVGEGPICDEAVRELVANSLKDDTGWLLEQQPRGKPPVDYIVGPLDEEDLDRAGIRDAEHVIICHEDDSKVIHASALVKGLNPRAKITALAKDKATIRILEQLGVDNIVPVAVLGRLLASSTFEPSVTTFLSDATTAGKGIDLTEYKAEGKTIEKIEEETGFRVVALVGKDGKVRLPKPGMTVKEDERVIVLRKTREDEEE